MAADWAPRRFLERGMRSWLAVMILAAAVPAWGQTQPADQSLSAAEQMLSDMLKPQAPPKGSPATRPQVESLEPAGYVVVTPKSLLREGTDIWQRSGHLRKLTDSLYPQIVFDNTEPGEKLPPMLVLPNLELMKMENAEAATTRDLQFVVSGTVTEYRKKNYILLDSGPPDLSSRLLPPVPKTQPTGEGSADQMLNEMLAADSKPLPPIPKQPPLEADRTSGTAAVAPGAPRMTVLRENSPIDDRICRLVATPDGQQEQLVLDSDGAALEDPPLIVLPNLKLMAMEDAAKGAEREQRFRVSGILMEYRGRNYILMDKVVLVPLANQF
jgi:hypothetical protein